MRKHSRIISIAMCAVMMGTLIGINAPVSSAYEQEMAVSQEYAVEESERSLGEALAGDLSEDDDMSSSDSADDAGASTANMDDEAMTSSANAGDEAGASSANVGDEAGASSANADDEAGASSANLSDEAMESVVSEDSGATASLASTDDTTSYSGLGVASHTKDEIISYIKASGSLLTDDVEYATEYSTTSPYAAGSLTEDTLNSALAMLNNMRYIAGLNYDVALDDTLVEKCQAGSMIMAANDVMDHFPTQPTGMDDTLYKNGYDATSHGNIATGFSNLTDCIVNGWMADNDDSNVAQVGHRAWCLNPTMGKTGFGMCGSYSCMYAHDKSYSSSINNIAWPAQVMPIEYFNRTRTKDDPYPWSVFTGVSEDIDTVVVTLTRKSDGKVWTFSKATSTAEVTPSDLTSYGTAYNCTDGYFSVMNFAQKGQIVFRPNDITEYADGDEFTVTVTGVDTPISYTVTFFSLGEELGHTHSYVLYSNKVSPDLTTLKSDGTMTGTATISCSGCGKEWQADSAKFTVTTEGVTCGFSGTYDYDSEIIYSGLKFTPSWSASGTVTHNYGEAVFTWDGANCTASQICSRCGDEKTGEECEVTSTTTATCTGDGVTTYTATFGDYTDIKTEDAKATGHTYEEPTFTWSDEGYTCTVTGTCTVCGATETVDCTITNEITTKPTCETAGVRTYTAKYGENKSTKTEAIAATGHTEVTDAAVEPTCTKTGLAEGSHCSVCDEVIKAQEEVAATGHTEVTDAAVAPTCTKTGLTEGSHCSVCGEVIKAQEEVAATGHTYGEPVFTWSDEGYTCTVTGTCTVCGATETVDCAVTNEITTQPTCETAGVRTYTAEYGENKSSKTEAIAATGHNYGEPVFTWDETNHTCTATQTCTVCNETTDSQSCEVTSETTVATCEEAGKTVYTATYNDNDFDTYEVTIPALGHSFTSYVSNNDATCTKDGTETATCDREGCGETDTRTVENSKLAHKFTDYVSNNDATCKKDGTKTAECDYGCGMTDTVTDEGSMVDHSYTNYVSNGDATCQKDGTKTAECDYNCGETDTVTDEGSKLAHTYGEPVFTWSDEGYTCTVTGTCTVCGAAETEECTVTNEITTQPTCETAGVRTYTAEYGENKSTKTEVVAATGHTAVTDAAVAPTCTKTGLTEGSHCSVCDEVIKAQEEVAATGHTEVTDAAVEPTCTESGLTEGSHCSVCGEVIKTQEEIAATGHTEVPDAAVAPTCTKTGLTEGSHCSVCDEVIKAQEVIAATGHTAVTDEAVAPTCIKTGLTEGSHCSTCGEVIKAQEIIAATGHTAVTDAAVAPTCTKTGLTEGSHCSVCGEVIKAQEVIAATGHTAGPWQVVKKATTSADGSQVKKCTVCGQTIQTQKIAKTFVIKPKATGIKSLTNTAKGVKLTWSKAASGTGYVIYRKTNSGAYKKVKTISSIKTVSYVDTGAKTNGAKYTYKVYVYKKVGGTSYRSAASAAKATYYVKAPTWKKLANTSSRKVTVKYAKNAKATGYQIQYATKKTFAGKKTITVKKASTTSAVIKSLKKGKTYYVRVRSYKKVNGKTYYSAWNTVKKVVVKK